MKTRNERYQAIQKLMESMRDPTHASKARWDELDKALLALYQEDGRTIVTLESRLTEAKQFINQTYGAQNG